MKAELTPQQRLRRAVPGLFSVMITPRIGEITEDEKRQFEGLTEGAKSVAYALFVLHMDDLLFNGGEPQYEVKGQMVQLTYKMQRTMIWRLVEGDEELFKMVEQHPAAEMFKDLAERGVM